MKRMWIINVSVSFRNLKFKYVRKHFYLFQISLGDSSIHDTNYSSYESICLSILSLISITVNTACAIACFRNMRSDFYQLSVFLLLLNDAFMALSSVLYGSTAIFLSSNQLVGICLFQTFWFAFGSLTQYSLLLFICLQRYLTIKSYNFGTNKIFKEYRYLIVIGNICFVFLFSLAVTLFTPFEKTIVVCSSTELYGHHFIIYFAFIFGLGAILMFFVISITVITGIRIWKIFFLSRVQPVNIEMHLRGSSNHNEAQFSNQSTPNHGIRRLSSISIHYQDNYAENDTVPNFNEQQSKTNSDVNYKHGRQVYSKSDKPSKRLPIISLVQIDKKAWEIRAFSTCIITVVSAIIFTGPFLVSYWMETLTDTVVASNTRSFILHTYVKLVCRSFYLCMENTRN